MQIQPLRLEHYANSRHLIEPSVEALVESYRWRLAELAAGVELRCLAAIGETNVAHELRGWIQAHILAAVCVKRLCWEQEFSAAFDLALAQLPLQKQPVAPQNEVFPSPFEDVLAAWAARADLCSPSTPGVTNVAREHRTDLHVWIDRHAHAGKDRDRNGSGSPAVPAYSRSAGPPVCRGVVLEA